MSCGHDERYGDRTNVESHSLLVRDHGLAWSTGEPNSHKSLFAERDSQCDLPLLETQSTHDHDIAHKYDQSTHT